MKRMISGILWIGMWLVLVAQQVPLAAVGAAPQENPQPAKVTINRKVPESAGYRSVERAGGVREWAQDQGVWLVSTKEGESEEGLKEGIEKGIEGMESYVNSHPESGWNGSLSYAIGKRKKASGRLSQALEWWERAWKELKKEKSAEGYELGNRVWSELAELNAGLGRIKRLEALLQESRQMVGDTSGKVEQMKEALWRMKNEPEKSFKCGPYALGQVRKALGEKDIFPSELEEEKSSPEGITLKRVEELARGIGYKAAKREKGSEVPVPSVVHWKVDHYAAVVGKEEREGTTIYHLEDPTFGEKWWVKEEIFDEEGSGYFLVKNLPQEGWAWASEAEKEKVRGKGQKALVSAIPPECQGTGPGGMCPAMPESGMILAGEIGVRIRDTPIWWEAKGSQALTISYTEGESQQAVWALGPKWQMNWGSCVTIVGNPALASPGIPPTCGYMFGKKFYYHDGRGGMEPVDFAPATMQAKSTHNKLGKWTGEKVPKQFLGLQPMGFGQGYGPLTMWMTDAQSDHIWKLTCHRPDGSKEVYAEVESNVEPGKLLKANGGQGGYGGGIVAYRLSQVISPQGEVTNFVYSGESYPAFWEEPTCIYPAPQMECRGGVRLEAIEHPNGMVTTFEYIQNPKRWDYLLTKVNDPYGRSASFGYDQEGRLISVTDMGGLTSTFSYEGNTDKIASMTTPYGTTSFSRGFQEGDHWDEKWVMTQRPDGRKEKVSRMLITQKIPSQAPAATLPSGPNEAPIPGVYTDNGFLSHRNLCYWKDWEEAVQKGDIYERCTIYHMGSTVPGQLYTMVDVIQSVKEPGIASRTYVSYPGQTSDRMDTVSVWKPAVVARVDQTLPTKRTQISRYEYNAEGNIKKKINPQGTETHYAYEDNGIDLKSVKIFDGTTPREVWSATYNTQHQILSETNESGATTTYGYTNGELTSVTDAEGKVTTMTYDSDGKLLSIVGPQGQTASIAYNSYGEVESLTDPEGYQVSYERDNFGRVTKIQYPDNTSEEVIWNLLDPEWSRNRRGQWSQTLHNNVRQVVGIRNPQWELTQMGWCRCGQLEWLSDPQGNTTHFINEDGRLKKRINADGSVISYSHDEVGRLKSVTDPSGGQAIYSYNADNTVSEIAYQMDNDALQVAQIEKVTYERNLLGQVTKRIDQRGELFETTHYSYQPIYPRIAGAGKLVGIDGPQFNDEISYTYDLMGRLVNRTIAGHTTTYGYDAQGRLEQWNNALGIHTRSYDGNTARVIAENLNSNAIQKTFGFNSLIQGKSLKEITVQQGATPHFHLDLQKHLGRIQGLEESLGTTSKQWDYDYDSAGQLVSAQKRPAGMSFGAPEQAWDWQYDPSGNRLNEQRLGNGVLTLSTTTHNAVNQLLTTQGGVGKVKFKGKVNEPAQVTIQGESVKTDANKAFQLHVPLSAGSHTVAIQLQDAANNQVTQNAQVTIAPGGSPQAFTYDARGNLLSDGIRTYAWNGLNQLVHIFQEGKKTTFHYDGEGKRVLTEERENGTLLSSHEHLWAGTTMVQERNVNGEVKAFYPQGYVINPGSLLAKKYFYVRDHLGSVRGVLNAQGDLVGTSDYTPYGEKVNTWGIQAPFGFTGHYFHQPSGLNLTLYRAYDPTIAKWLSKDPIGELGGQNLYGYVFNNPTNFIDPLGLAVPGIESPYWDAAKNPRGVAGVGPDGSFSPSTSFMLGNTMTMPRPMGPGLEGVAGSLAAMAMIGVLDLVISIVLDGAENNNDEDIECESIRQEFEGLRAYKESAEAKLVGLNNLRDRYLAALMLKDLKAYMRLLASRHNNHVPPCKGTLTVD